MPRATAGRIPGTPAHATSHLARKSDTLNKIGRILGKCDWLGQGCCILLAIVVALRSTPAPCPLGLSAVAGSKGAGSGSVRRKRKCVPTAAPATSTGSPHRNHVRLVTCMGATTSRCQTHKATKGGICGPAVFGQEAIQRHLTSGSGCTRVRTAGRRWTRFCPRTPWPYRNQVLVQSALA